MGASDQVYPGKTKTKTKTVASDQVYPGETKTKTKTKTVASA